MLKERLAIAAGRPNAAEDDHAIRVVGHRIHFLDEEEAMLATDDARNRDACFAIIL